MSILTQQILGSRCIGDTLITINTNFSNLDTAICSTSAALHTTNLNLSTLSATASGINLLTTNGYQQFYGGLIMQWGTIIATTTEGLNGPYTFPIAFPHACLNIQFTPIDAESGLDDCFPTVPQYHLPTTTQFWIYTQDPVGGRSVQGATWFAVGY